MCRRKRGAADARCGGSEVWRKRVQARAPASRHGKRGTGVRGLVVSRACGEGRGARGGGRGARGAPNTSSASGMSRTWCFSCIGVSSPYGLLLRFPKVPSSWRVGLVKANVAGGGSTRPDPKPAITPGGKSAEAGDSRRCVPSTVSGALGRCVGCVQLRSETSAVEGSKSTPAKAQANQLGRRRQESRENGPAGQPA